MPRPIALLLAALLVLPVAADPYPVQPGIDVQHYRFQLELGDQSNEIAGHAIVIVRVVQDGVSEMRLDLVSATDERGGRGMHVQQVLVNGTPTRFVHENDALTFALPPGSHAGSTVQVLVDYTGIPDNGLFIRENRHGKRTFFSDNWPNRTHHWLPTVDHIGDKATHEFVIDAPSKYQVVSNGLRLEETDLGGNRRRTHWKQAVPTSPWLYCLGVAEMAMARVGDFRGKEIQVWVFPEDREAGFLDLDGPTKRSLEFFEDYVGPFAYEKLANIQANSVGGGMEASSAIFYAENSVVGDGNARWRNVIIHEIAHQWFGCSVTEANWDHVWLSEGITTYFTLLFREYAYGRGDFVDGLKGSRRTIWRFHQDNPDYTIIHDNLADMSKVTSSHTYQKGAWFMHMLRNRIGDKAFQAGIRAYYTDHFNDFALTEDLQRHMETASGDTLGAFFDQWLRQGGHPVLDGSWRFEGESRLIVDLEQVQKDGYSFDLPVEIGVYENGSEVPTIHTLRLDGMGRRSITINLEGPPDRVEIDPRTVLLAEWTLERR